MLDHGVSCYAFKGIYREESAGSLSSESLQRGAVLR
jgi:hypothetical protein